MVAKLRGKPAPPGRWWSEPFSVDTEGGVSWVFIGFGIP